MTPTAEQTPDGREVEHCPHLCARCSVEVPPRVGNGHWSHLRIVGRPCMVGFEAACWEHRR